MLFKDLVAVFASVAAVQAADPSSSPSLNKVVPDGLIYTKPKTLPATPYPVGPAITTASLNTSVFTEIPAETFTSRLHFTETDVIYQVVNLSNISNAASSSLHSRLSTGGSNPDALNVGMFGAAIAVGAAFLF